MLTLRSKPTQKRGRRGRLLFLPRFLLQKGGVVKPEGKHPCEEELALSFMWLYPAAPWTKDERLELSRYILHTHFKRTSSAALGEAIKLLSNYSSEDALARSPQQLITSCLDKVIGTPWALALQSGARQIKNGDGVTLHPFVRDTLSNMATTELKQLCR